MKRKYIYSHLIILFICFSCTPKNKKKVNYDEVTNTLEIRIGNVFKDFLIKPKCEVLYYDIDSINLQINFETKLDLPCSYSKLIIQHLIVSDTLFENRNIKMNVINKYKAKNKKDCSFYSDLESIKLLKSQDYKNKVFKNLIEFLLKDLNIEDLSYYNSMISQCSSNKQDKEFHFLSLIKPLSNEVCLSKEGDAIDCMLGLFSQIQYYLNIEDPTNGLISKEKYENMSSIIGA